MVNTNQKYNHAVLFIIGSGFLASCTNNKLHASISEIGHSYSLKKTGKHDQSRSLIKKYSHYKINRVLQENSLYNRNYNNLQKGSYHDTRYEVKSGDTLFYIAWITGNNYKDLARKNNIQEPYILHVGKVLQITNKTVDLIRKEPLGENDLPFYTNEQKSKQNAKNILKIFHREKNILNDILPSTKLIKSTKITPDISPSPNTIIIGWCWPTNGKILDHFVDEAGGNKGIDISGSRGQAILASANGKVVYAGNALQGYGNLIIIKHKNDYLSAYAHNEKMLVREEELVLVGQKIATMGSTGSNTIRLHFEIRYKGKSVNPLIYLPKR
ncbi:metalloendopeptidase-like membrane protein [secondary endosymbiont of Heteropsylla cubana]|uniref:Murein hydrolase activator NlpD n=1 Tax=secondary endosymbiont of Heteropsylla cubana TaxID=134287 RepID=J3TGZ0_9ENTR|nr:murein hydrolase activator NlpD [secondary endosymbiont of Heteropsylla cubana]AFP85802.1 metalloendopeptidase-like membrane protein [secondary endosymbiont of Heteropsylla cubana]